MVRRMRKTMISEIGHREKTKSMRPRLPPPESTTCS